MAQTAARLQRVLKENWTEDIFSKQFDIEVQGASLDAQREIQRQIYQPTPRYWTSSNISPPLLHERKARQAEMMQRFAAKKRGNKPSYRQRQKNGRKAAGR